jgi:hypothetical protein
MKRFCKTFYIRNNQIVPSKGACFPMPQYRGWGRRQTSCDKYIQQGHRWISCLIYVRILPIGYPCSEYITLIQRAQRYDCLIGSYVSEHRARRRRRSLDTRRQDGQVGPGCGATSDMPSILSTSHCTCERARKTKGKQGRKE